ncbi:MAG: nuclear transport factor 2 family protein [Armatimonadetes bacterium]|nr:nuclear transport factor 2 family protein [Armatimonadota bacterium]
MDSKTLADNFIAALHALEEATDESPVEPLANLYADDAEIINTALLLGGEKITGKEGATEFWTQYKKTIGVGKSHFHHIAASDKTAGLFWKTTVMNGASEYDGATLLEFDDAGKIVFFQGYYDTRQLNHAIGLSDK